MKKQLLIGMFLLVALGTIVNAFSEEYYCYYDFNGTGDIGTDLTGKCDAGSSDLQRSAGSISYTAGVNVQDTVTFFDNSSDKSIIMCTKFVNYFGQFILHDGEFLVGRTQSAAGELKIVADAANSFTPSVSSYNNYWYLVQIHIDETNDKTNWTIFNTTDGDCNWNNREIMGTTGWIDFKNGATQVDEINYAVNGGDGHDGYFNFTYMYPGLGSSPAFSGNPTITQVNFTSEGNQDCTSSTCGPTDDTTPTFKITTDIPANCRISDTNDTFNTMGISRGCTGTETTELTCTLTTQDSLILGGTDYVYVACNNRETITEITMDLQENASIGDGLSKNATQAILAGIDASGLVTPTLYQDQQVYLRYSDNTQKLATVDMVAVQGNQRWLLNYLINETATDITSIGTIVNVWENISLTYNQIVDQVRNFIDSTLS
ncbi:hypothetical protein ACFLYT_00755 [Nanoarchaeota archaeon]